MTTRARPVGVAVVGLGVGEQHARAYAALPSCRLVALCDLDEARSRSLSAALGGPRTTRVFDDLLADPEVDLVSLASYDDAHGAQAEAALRAGKHVFVEKPLCGSRDELKKLKAAWAAQGGRLKLSSNLVLRAAPLYREARRMAKEGAFGELYAIDGEYLYGRLHKITEGWRKAVDHYSVMVGGGIHLADLLLWLTGQRPNRVTASGNRICTRDTEFRYPDYVAATLDFPSGLVGRLTANFGCVHRHQHVVRMFGTKATLLVDDAGPRLHESRDPARPSRRLDAAALPATKGDLIPDFVEAVVRDADLGRDTQAFFDGLSLCLACDEALKHQTGVTIEYV
jgi:predicted dehydrogenase